MSLGRWARAVCGVVAVLLPTGPVVAQTGEWPQFAGPHRDYKADAKPLAASWPDAGPRRLWRRDLGEGWSSIAVDAGRLYTMYRKGEQDVVISMDAATGQTLWEFAYDAPFILGGRDADLVKEYHLEQGPGPISTPTIAGDRLFSVGATGWLHALEKKTGKLIWKHNLILELQGYIRQRGYGPSPLVYKDTIILPVGAVGGAIMAFNQMDGSIVWRKHDFKHAYASPILVNVGGQDQVALFMADRVIGFDPSNGDLLWNHQLRGVTEGTHVSLPVWGDGNLLFFSAAYGLGGHVLQLTKTGDTTTVREVWRNPKVSLHYSNAVRIDNVMYGTTGDFGPAFFSAWNVETGAILWQQRAIGRGTFIAADGRFIVIFEDGTLALVTATPTGMTIDAQVELMQRNAWTVPTLVGTTLYVRDRKTLVALELPAANGPTPVPRR